MEIFSAGFDIAKWFIGGGVSVVALGFVAFYFPPLRPYALAAIAVMGIGMFIYGKGVNDNAILAKAKQEKVEVKAIKTGKAARSNAARTVKRGVPDGWCRDCSK